MNQNKGIRAAQIMSQLLLTYPIIRPTVMIIKYILRKKGLNEPYTGGIGSFVIFNMVYSYILFLIRIKKISFTSNTILNIDENQELEKLFQSKFFSSREISNIADLGTFLYGFLNFFGFEFDYIKYGISNLGIGNFFNKRNSRFFYSSEKLCILNILDPSQDICRTAYNYDKIVELFQGLVIKINKFDKFFFGLYEYKEQMINKVKNYDKKFQNIKNDKIKKESKSDSLDIFSNFSKNVKISKAVHYDNISYFDKMISYPI